MKSKEGSRNNKKMHYPAKGESTVGELSVEQSLQKQRDELLVQNTLPKMFGRKMESVNMGSRVHHVEHIILNEGECVYEEGDDMDGIYFILKGKVNVFIKQGAVLDPMSSGFLIAQLEEGDFFGELVESPGKRSTTCVAASRTFLAWLHFVELEQVLGENRKSKATVRLLAPPEERPEVPGSSNTS